MLLWGCSMARWFSEFCQVPCLPVPWFSRRCIRLPPLFVVAALVPFSLSPFPWLYPSSSNTLDKNSPYNTNPLLPLHLPPITLKISSNLFTSSASTHVSAHYSSGSCSHTLLKLNPQRRSNCLTFHLHTTYFSKVDTWKKPFFGELDPSLSFKWSVCPGSLFQPLRAQSKSPGHSPLPLTFKHWLSKSLPFFVCFLPQIVPLLSSDPLDNCNIFD